MIVFSPTSCTGSIVAFSPKGTAPTTTDVPPGFKDKAKDKGKDKEKDKTKDKTKETSKDSGES